MAFQYLNQWNPFITSERDKINTIWKWYGSSNGHSSNYNALAGGTEEISLSLALKYFDVEAAESPRLRLGRLSGDNLKSGSVDSAGII